MTITAPQCRAARAMVRISRQQLAVAANVGLRTIDYFEDNQRIPRAASLASIRKVLEGYGVVFLETWWGAHGILERVEKPVTKDNVKLNSTIPTSGELYVNAVCAVWDTIRMHVRNPRQRDDYFDSRIKSIQLRDDAALKDAYSDGVAFTVNMVSPQIQRSVYSSLKRNKSGIISHFGIAANYQNTDMIRFSVRTYRDSEPDSDDDSAQLLVDIDGKPVRIRSAAVVFEEDIEHQDYFRKSLEWCELIAGYIGDAA
ncbi:MAG: hypothetical protein HQL37_11050 [Alphaproteobacteria bacterium]|nr:hypothetical protein [Alphaproteobacteria bacterium]